MRRYSSTCSSRSLSVGAFFCSDADEIRPALHVLVLRRQRVERAPVAGLQREDGVVGVDHHHVELQPRLVDVDHLEQRATFSSARGVGELLGLFLEQLDERVPPLGLAIQRAQLAARRAQRRVAPARSCATPRCPCRARRLRPCAPRPSRAFTSSPDLLVARRRRSTRRGARRGSARVGRLAAASARASGSDLRRGLARLAFDGAAGMSSGCSSRGAFARLFRLGALLPCRCPWPPAPLARGASAVAAVARRRPAVGARRAGAAALGCAAAPLPPSTRRRARPSARWPAAARPASRAPSVSRMNACSSSDSGLMRLHLLEVALAPSPSRASPSTR